MLIIFYHSRPFLIIGYVLALGAVPPIRPGRYAGHPD
jgi:hypothetical protein